MDGASVGSGSGAAGLSAGRMVGRVATVAFQGIEVLDVDVQVQMSGGVLSCVVFPA